MMICRTHWNHKIYDDELDWVKVPKHPRPAVSDPRINRWRFITHGCGVVLLADIIAGVALIAAQNQVWAPITLVLGVPLLLFIWAVAAVTWAKYDDDELAPHLLSCRLYLPNESGCCVGAVVSEPQIEPYQQAGFRIQFDRGEGPV